MFLMLVRHLNLADRGSVLYDTRVNLWISLLIVS